jgi:hypothetical protein
MVARGKLAASLRIESYNKFTSNPVFSASVKLSDRSSMVPSMQLFLSIFKRAPFEVVSPQSMMAFPIVGTIYFLIVS